MTRSTHWFFDDYLATWIGVGAGTIAARARVHPRLLVRAPALERRPESIGGFWTRRPWWASWSSSIADCVHAGYAHTAVPDWRVRVYHDDGAAIEVIWSRQRADGTEIERVAAHFEVARGSTRMAHPQHPGRTDHQRLTQSRMAAST